MKIFRILLLIGITLVVLSEEAGPPGCVTTCCMRCEELNNCDICNSLYKYDPERCPCLDDLNLKQDDFLKIQKSLDSSINTIRDRGRSSARRNTQMMSERPLSEVWAGVFMEPGACRPVCCPTLRCTPELCPRCHQRNKERPDKCPCFKF